ncbi:hypothetical protein EDD21DRAFT_392731 [Dissophora ornata]|nr:hypothetical protein EDD21DRAFT_392731 [Dissophora ornata]
MQHTRSLVGVLARSTPSSSRNVISTATRVFTPSSSSASFHTVRVLSAEEKQGGFLSRLNPFAKPAAPKPAAPSPAEAAKAAQDLNVEIVEEEEKVVPSWKNERQELTAEQLEESIRSAATPFVDTTTKLNKIRLDGDLKTKFEVLKACVVSTGRDIPNKDLASIHTLKDVLTTMQRLDQEANALPENIKGHVVAQWFEKNKSTLPPNMVFIPYQKSKGIKVEDRKTSNKRFL